MKADHHRLLQTPHLGLGAPARSPSRPPPTPVASVPLATSPPSGLCDSSEEGCLEDGGVRAKTNGEVHLLQRDLCPPERSEEWGAQEQPSTPVSESRGRLFYVFGELFSTLVVEQNAAQACREGLADLNQAHPQHVETRKDRGITQSGSGGGDPQETCV